MCEYDPVQKRLIRGALKAIAGVAALAFILAPMRTYTGLLIFAGSIVVMLVSFGLLKAMEGEDENTGYWPDDPKQ